MVVMGAVGRRRVGGRAQVRHDEAVGHESIGALLADAKLSGYGPCRGILAVARRPLLLVTKLHILLLEG